MTSLPSVSVLSYNLVPSSEAESVKKEMSAADVCLYS